MSKNKLVTIGIPVLNEELNIPTLMERLNPIIEEISKKEIDIEVIVNNNASSDGSAVLLDNWAAIDPRICVNHFESKVPYQESILRLLQHSHGDAFVLLQSDLQDPPELIPGFVDNWQAGEKIVAGVIAKRTEGFFQRSVRKTFYKVLKSFSDGEIIVGFQDFYLLDRRIINELKFLSPQGLFLRGHIATRFGSVLQIPYLRADRQRGTSNFGFPAKYSLALDGLLLFGTRFIRVVSTISFGVFCFGVIGAFTLLLSYLFGYRASVNGWASLGLVLLTLLSLLGMTTGLILEYLIRIYRFQVFQKFENK